MANIIRTGKLHQVLGKIETSSNQGMHTLEQHLLALIEEGKITEEEALLHANDANFENRIMQIRASKSKGFFGRR